MEQDVYNAYFEYRQVLILILQRDTLLSFFLVSPEAEVVPVGEAFLKPLGQVASLRHLGLFEEYPSRFAELEVLEVLELGFAIA